MNYSLLRSKTFWTLIVMFATDALSIYGGLLPADLLGLINLALTTLASYFHLQTGKSITGSN